MDISTLRLPRNTTPTPRKRRYLRGPIDWEWLHVAGRLPGASLKVGLVLWHYRALNKSLTFKTGARDISKFLLVSIDTVSRAIDALESAGLIQLDCASGQKCVFTMVEVPPAGTATERGKMQLETRLVRKE